MEAEKIIEILTDAEHRLAMAWVEGDRGFIEATLADDWIVTDLTGRVLTKDEVLRETFGSNDREIVSMTIDEIHVRPFGAWAIVTGLTEAAGKYEGQVMEVRLRFTDIFVVRDGRWQVVASQATLLGE